MHGKTVVITGATSGIGKACATALANAGAAIIGVSRDPQRCARVERELNGKSVQAPATFFDADLSQIHAVRQVADQILAKAPVIDVLINNVGAAFFRRGETPEGLERTFALNHLSYFLLTDLLLDRILSSRPARIINVSSSAHTNARIHFNDIQLSQDYQGMKAYGQSKLANLLFSYELDRRLQGTGVTVNAMHPGFVRTRIGRDNGWLGRLIQPLITLRGISPEEGAQTLVYLATSPDVEAVTGQYFVDGRAIRSSDASYVRADMDRLWELSEQFIRTVDSRDREHGQPVG